MPENRVANHKRQNTGFRSANQVEVDFVFMASGIKNSCKPQAAIQICLSAVDRKRNQAYGYNRGEYFSQSDITRSPNRQTLLFPKNVGQNCFAFRHSRAIRSARSSRIDRTIGPIGKHRIMNWHYVKDNTQTGPVDHATLEALFRAGTINASTLVWSPGMETWIPYSEALPGQPPAIIGNEKLSEGVEPVAVAMRYAGSGSASRRSSWRESS